jgi:hypothetical protein
MDDRSVFHLISDVTHEEGVSCVLIGGFAINHYRVTRQTADVDFLITKEDFDKISGFLEKAGYKKALLQENFAQFQSSRLSLLDVDFMFVDRETLAKIMKEGQRFRIAGETFTVPSLYHLIALKLHSIKNNPKLRMTRDLPDIINLIRVNKINVHDKEFKDMCLKYGTVEICDQIMKAAQ